MKKITQGIIIAICVFFAVASVGAQQIKSTMSVTAGDSGNFSTNSQYFATGTQSNGVQVETQAASSYDVRGQLPEVSVIKDTSNGFASETLIVMNKGQMDVQEKAGSTLLYITKDQPAETTHGASADPTQTAIWVQSAAGSVVLLNGNAIYSTNFDASGGGVVMNGQVQFMGPYGTWQVGAAHQMVEGPVLPDGQTVVPVVKVQYEDHVSVGVYVPGGAGWFNGAYGVSIVPDTGTIPVSEQ